ncbi:MAG: hypothetical protein V3S04_03270 [Candidatus Omnitrophota bacterium]
MGRKIVLCAVLLALSFCGTASAFDRFDVYTDRWAPNNHFVPSGWMGDYGDIKVNDGWSDNPYSGKNCIKLTYNAEASQGAGWMGVFWQNPANNWGARDGGFDLTGAKTLLFWARGDKGGEVITEFKVGGITGEYGDSDSTGIGPVVLTDKWKEYSIDLADVDISYISGGFCVSASKMDNPDGFSVYLDDIRFE